ncbi:hypothetical protein [Phascolarctobacterium faecium]|uniref:hypothetical protein n=1 Tax=Phascolarctobacterium faecium TaxID=33025 RepID=UPI003AB83AF2
MNTLNEEERSIINLLRSLPHDQFLNAVGYLNGLIFKKYGDYQLRGSTSENVTRRHYPCTKVLHFHTPDK